MSGCHNRKNSDRSQGLSPVRRNRPRSTRNLNPRNDFEIYIEKTAKETDHGTPILSGRKDQYVRCESKANMLEAKKDLEADNNYYESDSCSEEDDEMYSSSEEYFPMSEEEEESSDESDYSEDDSEYDSDDSEE